MRLIQYLLLIACTSFITVSGFAQCPCPKMSLGNYGTKPVKIFKLTDTDSLAVCGGMQQKDGHEEYSDFIVYACDQLFSAGSWDGTQTCTITQNKDTLLVHELYPVANGPGMTISWQPFYETMFYVPVSPGASATHAVTVTSYFRRDLRKYTETEIQQALAGYKSIHLPVKNYDPYLLAVHRLFWAYVSGSKEAGIQLEALRKQYGTFDGAVSEAFDSIIMNYERYKKDYPLSSAR